MELMYKQITKVINPPERSHIGKLEKKMSECILFCLEDFPTRNSKYERIKKKNLVLYKISAIYFESFKWKYWKHIKLVIFPSFFFYLYIYCVSYKSFQDVWTYLFLFTVFDLFIFEVLSPWSLHRRQFFQERLYETTPPQKVKNKTNKFQKVDVRDVQILIDYQS